MLCKQLSGMELIIGIAQTCIGIIISLVGFKLYNPFKNKNDEEWEKQWYKKFGTFFKIAGPAISLLGLHKIFTNF